VAVDSLLSLAFKKCVQNLVVKPLGICLLGRPSRMRQSNIEIDLGEISSKEWGGLYPTPKFGIRDIEPLASVVTLLRTYSTRLILNYVNI
jgi:hypothetical protein